jgi:hypothetical protein
MISEYPEMKDKLLSAIGSMPKKVALEPVVLERVDCGTYFREMTEYLRFFVITNTRVTSISARVK